MTGPPQIIPRPPSARPGPPSPWADVPAASRTGLSLQRVRPLLSTPFDRGRGADVVRESAVLAALFEDDGESRIILTRRASTLRSHTGQVAFPGGRVEGHETLVEAALREASEEVGIDPAGVDVIGTLTPLMTFASPATINPFVGVLGRRPTLRTSPAEVEAAYDVALADLLVEGVHRTERWEIDGAVRVMDFFDLPDDIVWGATDRMLAELLARVTGTAGRAASDEGTLP